MKATYKDFWAITETIGWGEKTTDTQAVLAKLRTKFTDAYIDELHELATNFANLVYIAASKTEKSTGTDNFFDASDDGWSDATYHIVGLGEDVYNKFIANPDKWIAERGTNFYTENFGYCFSV